ncbi:hypothetical protein CR492_02955 [Methylocella silvestris]|uniref:Uncharacterized protein n=1 Tax=Methylocella silvestris TaxID=199596 RepID=A0A2J7TM60_METSI|nr:hypothetical protein CR492_02955 [Methylocella silvestris]
MSDVVYFGMTPGTRVRNHVRARRVSFCRGMWIPPAPFGHSARGGQLPQQAVACSAHAIEMKNKYYHHISLIH